MKRLFSLVFALLMTFAVCFALARPFEDTVKADVTYLDVWSTDKTYDSGYYFSDRIKISRDVKLTLGENVKLTFEKGICVPAGSTLTIEGSGIVKATLSYADDSCTGMAAIGGDSDNPDAGTIIINGCQFELRGGYNAAAIGGGYRSGHAGKSGNITINAGVVTADGGYNAAGIGGSNGGNSEDITINGGTVTSRGGRLSNKDETGWGAGIGGGYGGSAAGIITINGGTVTATGRYGAAGIGGGYQGNANLICVNGGEVTAIGGSAYPEGDPKAGGAGIGGGYSASVNEISITGGKVYARAEADAAAIGGGYRGAFDKITVASDVTAVANNTGAGIGAGGGADPAELADSQIIFGSYEDPLAVDVTGGVGMPSSGGSGVKIQFYKSLDKDNDRITVDEYRASTVEFKDAFVNERSREVFFGDLADTSSINGDPLIVANLYVDFVNYDGSKETKTVYYGNKLDYFEPEFNPDAVEFLGWSRDQNNEDLWNFGGDDFLSDTTLHSYWRYDYYIEFDDGGEAEGSMDTVLLRKTGAQTPYVLPECAFTARPGRAFIGWMVDGMGDLLDPGDTIEVTHDIVLCAIWDDLHWITFEKPDGVTGSMYSVPVIDGREYTLPEFGWTLDDPDRYFFTGWTLDYDDELLAPGYTFKVYKDTKVYSHFGNYWDDLQNKIDNAGNGETIVLENDVIAPGSVTGPLISPSGRTLTIDLKGHVIDRHLDLNEYCAGGNVITVKSGASLTIRDSSSEGTGAVTGGSNRSGSGGIIVEGDSADNRGVLILESGEIRNNISVCSDSVGGAVGLGEYATFEMSGGSINNNTTYANGGGVYLSSSASFTMDGGQITDNASDARGGGIYAADGAELILNDGSVAGNKASVSAAGIYVAEASAVTINGGQITGNRLTSETGVNAGIDAVGAVIHISGSPVIGNNTLKDGSASDLVVNKTMMIDGALSANASIAFIWDEEIDTYFWGTKEISSGLAGNGDENNFVLDMDDPFLIGTNADGELVLSWSEMDPVFMSNYGNGYQEERDDSYHVPYGTRFVLPDCMFQPKENCSFVEWSVEGVPHKAGDVIIVTQNIVIKAIWMETIKTIGIDIDLPECGTDVTTEWRYAVIQTNSPALTCNYSNGGNVIDRSYWLNDASYDPDNYSHMDQFLNNEALTGGNSYYAVIRLETPYSSTGPKVCITDDTEININCDQEVNILDKSYNDDCTEAYIIISAAIVHNYHEVEDSAVEATCTTNGKHADQLCDNCGYESVGEVIEALGHDYQIVEGSAVPASCDQDGKENDKKCSRCGDEQSGAVIPATGHDWEYKGIEWAGTEQDGYSLAAAKYVCKHNETHTKVISASISKSVTEPSCTADGFTTYTATVAEDSTPDGVERTDVKTGKPVPMIDHEYGTPTYTWSDDLTKVTAVRSCVHCEAEETETADTTSSVGEPATCMSEGIMNYKAVFKNQAFKQQVRAENIPIDPDAHEWEFKGFIWTGNETDGFSEAKASYACKHNGDHKETVDIILDVKVNEPSSIEGGKTVYTATVEASDSLDGIEHTESKDAKITAPLTLEIVTAPQGKTTDYINDDQALVTGGEVRNGIMIYALGDDADTAPSDGWDQDIPSGKDAGTYYVWYKAVSHDQLSSTEPVCVTSVINRIEPDVPAHPEGLTAVYGDSLADVNIPASDNGTWEWQEDLSTKVGVPGGNTHKARFIHNDKTNYLPVEDIDLNIVVSKADLTPEIPEDLTAVCQGKLEDIGLPEDENGRWTWNNSQEEVGEADEGVMSSDKTFKATYTPFEDQYYNTKEYDLTVTVSHDPKTIDEVKPSCEEIGKTSYEICSVCGKTIVSAQDIPATGHSWETTIQKASFDRSGSVTKICSVCGAEETEVIAQVTKITLDAASYTYTGEAIEPELTVGSESEVLPKDCYTVEYSNNIEVGTGLIKVILKGDYYQGSKTVSFRIKAKPATPTPTATATPTASPTPTKVPAKPTASPTPTKAPAKPTATATATPTPTKTPAKPTATATATATPKPAKNSIKRAKVEFQYSDYEYREGTEQIKPAIKVFIDGTRLKSKTDFTGELKNNDRPGTASITLTGQGKYKDSVTYDFNISAVVSCGKTLDLSCIKSWKGATFAISNKTIASVDKSGKITGKQAGTATVTVTLKDGKKEKFNLRVLYKDVTDINDFWYEPTNALTAKGIVKGYDKQTNFKPANECSRAQMVTFLWRLAGEPKPSAKMTSFKDIKSSDYFYKPVLWAVEKGITTGVSKTKFDPQGICTRAQTVTFLWRMAGKPAAKAKTCKFSDVKSSDYFYKATIWASEKKIVAGYDDGTFKPQGKCLRRQMVTFLYKYDKFVNGKG